MKKTPVSFPCQYVFKAMLKNQPQAEMIVAVIVAEHASLCEGALSCKMSKKKNYVSVSCSAKLEIEQQLLSIYQALNNHPDIIMTL